MICLTKSMLPVYSESVANKEATRFDSLNTSKRTDRAMRFFYVRMSLHAFFGRQWRGSLRACWFPLVYQSVNPTICRPPRLTVGSGSTAHQGACHD